MTERQGERSGKSVLQERGRDRDFYAVFSNKTRERTKVLT